jgi:hypothetical protein
MADEVLKTVK